MRQNALFLAFFTVKLCKSIDIPTFSTSVDNFCVRPVNSIVTCQARNASLCTGLPQFHGFACSPRCEVFQSFVLYFSIVIVVLLLVLFLGTTVPSRPVLTALHSSSPQYSSSGTPYHSTNVLISSGSLVIPAHFPLVGNLRNRRSRKRAAAGN